MKNSINALLTRKQALKKYLKYEYSDQVISKMKDEIGELTEAISILKAHETAKNGE